MLETWDDKIFKFLAKHDRRRRIMDRDGIAPYLERGYLLWNSDGKDTKDRNAEQEGKKIKRMKDYFNVFIHRFLQSDVRGLFHTHPWPFITIILRHGYWEHTPDGQRTWYGPGSIIFRKASDMHWVELPQNKHPVTLFIHFKRVDTWAFLHGKELIQHNEYLKNYRGKK